MDEPSLLAGELDVTDVLVADYEAYCAREGVGGSEGGAGSIRYRLQYERGQLAALEPFLIQIIDAQPAVPVWRMALCGVYLQSDRPELAKPQVEALGADDFAIVPRNAVFLLTCASAARIASQVGALDVAECAYHHAARFDDRFPFSGTAFEYPVGIGVGAAAGALGWFDKAERHFAQSLALCERSGAPTYLAATHVHWAEMLAKRDSVGDAARATEMAVAALSIAQRLGLAYVQKRAERLLDR